MRPLKVIVLVAACASLGLATASEAAAQPPVQPAPAGVNGSPTLGTSPPNIIFILADDFSTNLASPQRLVDSMPNLARMVRDGASFSNYFVTDSLCCPSRASIFTGKFPHNHGVFANAPPLGGITAFNANGDDAHSFALALQASGYKTAMMGKYLNGYDPTIDGPAPGWNEWDVAGTQGYLEYHYTLNQNGAVTHAPGVYLTDEVSMLGRTFVANSASTPFFLEIATFAPHAPYIPAHRDENNFPGLTYSRAPPFAARPNSTAPAWLKRIPALTPSNIGAIDMAFRMRVQSDQAIDQMIGDIRAFLVSAGLDKNTYVIFSSDNGLHMGEYSLLPGKLTPFDTDVRVPLVIVGPGVPAGVSISQIVQNVDLAPTFTAIARAPAAPTQPDGQNLLPLIGTYASGGIPPPWRQMALIEHKRPVQDPLDPDGQSWRAGEPPNYGALRFASTLYVQYDDPLREIGYYNLTTDPFELNNIASVLAASQLLRLQQILNDNKNCVGAAACLTAQQQAAP